MKKSIGIFLAYSPGQSIKGHGISRLLSFILHGMQQNDNNHIVIATPKWFEESIIEFLREQLIDLNRVEILATPSVPPLIRIKQYLSLRRKNSHKGRGKSYQPIKGTTILQLIKKTAFLASAHWISTSSLLVFTGISVLFMFFGLLSLPFIMLAAVVSIVMVAAKSSKKITRKIFEKTGRLHFLLKIQKVHSYLYNHFIHLLRNKQQELKDKLKAFIRLAYLEARKHELAKLTRLINNKPEVSVWFSPTPFWPEIKNIKAKKVIAAPDVVFVDFPTYFASEDNILTHAIISQSIRAADHLICYSQYVKHKHLIQAFTVDSEKITVIPHGVTELSSTFDNELAKKSGATLREQSLRILHKYQITSLDCNPYLADYNLNDMRFIFYSSQLRPHKNMFNLVRALEILLRERYMNIKLVVTADLTADSELYNYILAKRLQFDILSFHDVSTEVLSALNHLAICAVNPSLFEGGFPFTFNEAYSVGTPSVMSNIPVVLEEISDESLREQMLFDPYNLNDMIDKIEWAVKNADQLFELQAPLYQKFKQRSWGLVAKEYVNLLTDFTQVTHEPA